MNPFTITNTTIIFVALIHGLIDLNSALVVYNCAAIHNLAPGTAAAYTILYDIMAFALQPIFGTIIDIIKRNRFIAVVGVVLEIAGICCTSMNALAAIVLVGIGNALYHLCIGAEILTTNPDSASKIGIFTGPGALGLSIGLWYGTHGFNPFHFMIASLLISAVALIVLPKLTAEYKTPKTKSAYVPTVVLITLFTLAAIALRGFVGYSGFTGLQKNAFSVIGLGVAACTGKITGGTISDKFGWKITTLTALLLSGMCIIFTHYNIFFAFLAMLLFQMPMAVTLTATARALPGKPAIAFGLTCLVLFCGTYTSYHAPHWLYTLPVTLHLITIAGGFIIYSLHMFDRSVNRESSHEPQASIEFH